MASQVEVLIKFWKAVLKDKGLLAITTQTMIEQTIKELEKK